MPTNKSQSKPTSAPADGRIAGCQSDHAGPCRGDLWICRKCGTTVCYQEGSDDLPDLCDACWRKAKGAG